MIYLIVFSTLAVLTAAVDDTPFANFTLKLAKHLGGLVFPTAEHLSPDKSDYEGRWYIVYLGVKESQAKGLSCVAFDSFFDNDGNLHSFFNIKDNGETKVLISEKKPYDSKKGIYDDFFGQPPFPKIKALFYYVDEDMIAILDLADAKIMHSQDLIVALRDVKLLSKKKAQIDQIYRSLARKGVPCEKHKICHHNCQHPEPMQNPYKAE